MIYLCVLCVHSDGADDDELSYRRADLMRSSAEHQTEMERVVIINVLYVSSPVIFPSC